MTLLRNSPVPGPFSPGIWWNGSNMFMEGSPLLSQFLSKFGIKVRVLRLGLVGDVHASGAEKVFE